VVGGREADALRRRWENEGMETRVDEIAEGIFRLSTLVPVSGAAGGFTFNEFLIAGDEPLLFHCGQHRLFPSVSAALRRVLDPARLRWIGFSHVEADECGALPDWLALAPNAAPVHGRMGLRLWLNDTVDRPARELADGEVVDLGGKRVRWLDTPHVPHNWEAGLILEETTGTLFCSDVLTQVGETPVRTRDDILGPAIAIADRMGFMPPTPQTAPTLRRLAALSPRCLALMHGPAFEGDGAAALEGLALHYETRVS
jgi:flavorubredoxin